MIIFLALPRVASKNYREVSISSGASGLYFITSVPVRLALQSIAFFYLTGAARPACPMKCAVYFIGVKCEVYFTWGLTLFPLLCVTLRPLR